MKQKLAEWTAYGFVGVLLILAVILIAAALMLIPAGLLFLAWKGVAVPVFHAPVLTFWQTYGLCWLLSIIGGFFKSSSSSKD